MSGSRKRCFNLDLEAESDVFDLNRPESTPVARAPPVPTRVVGLDHEEDYDLEGGDRESHLNRRAQICGLARNRDLNGRWCKVLEIPSNLNRQRYIVLADTPPRGPFRILAKNLKAPKRAHKDEARMFSAELYAERQRAVCKISVRQSCGTGFLVSLSRLQEGAPQGHVPPGYQPYEGHVVMTNYHVLRDADMARDASLQFHIEPNLWPTVHRLDPDKFFRADKDLDFAIVAVMSGKVPNVEPIPIKHKSPAVGEQLILWGHPDGGEKKASLGKTISYRDGGDHMEHDCATFPGSSGSPLLSADSELQLVALHFGATYSANMATVMERIVNPMSARHHVEGPSPGKRPAPGPTRTPITLISGFLGAGKTTLLRSMLENKEGLKIGVVVNDVASVNIDAKLMKGVGGGSSAPGDTIELQNGCACCSAAEEFMQAIDKLVELAETRGVPYDHIVVEATGVAEPNEVRSTFQRADEDGEELMAKVELRTLVTVVDASTFVELFDSKGKLAERPDLGEDDGVSNVGRKVVELLVEQVETADIVVINKADQLQDAAQLGTLRQMIAAMNPMAAVHVTSWGKLRLSALLTTDQPQRAAVRDRESDLRRHSKKLRETEPLAKEPHEHGHAHGDEHAHAQECKEQACMDPTHKHGHAHGHGHGDGDGHAQECKEQACTDPTHKHGHGHGDAHAQECKEEVCTDPTHKHAHGHGHTKPHGVSRHVERFGISSFVYARRRPFHPQRLVDRCIQHLPAKQKLALKDQLQRQRDPKSPFANVIRSKGFVWLSNNHLEVFYWAHAGSYFEVKKQGLWWVTIEVDDWPQEDAADIEAEMVAVYGDRRQELVFIGIEMDEDAMTAELDHCLLTDAEMVTYKEFFGAKFPNDAICYT